MTSGLRQLRYSVLLALVFLFVMAPSISASTQTTDENAKAELPSTDDVQSDETIEKDVDETSGAQWIEDPPAPVLEGNWIEDPDTEETVKGPRYALERIVIVGNKKTLRQVVLRYVDISPGEVFSADDPRLEKARYRLLAAGLFYNVQLSLRRGTKRGWAVLEVVVKERNTIIVQDIVFGLSEITPYGSLGVNERSFLGSAISVSAAAVVSKEQYGYRLQISDDHFLNSDFGLHVEGQFSQARDFFGTKNVYLEDSDSPPTYRKSSQYAAMGYNRARGRLGTSYELLSDSFLSIDYRFEVINADVPRAAYHSSFGENKPIEFGHLLPGHSILSSLLFGVIRDTRDSSALASTGMYSAFEVELATELVGSDYEFSKFTLTHDSYFPLGKGHSIKLGLFAGLIMGDAPFFNQFFVGDFSSFVPSRVLEMNFSHLQSGLLETSIKEMRYEDLAASIGLEYSAPFYRGERFFYGINGFVGLGIFFLASQEDFRIDPKGYSGYEVVPMDLTMDVGIKIDTQVGVFVISLANLFRLIPGVDETAEE
jgi:outer membrane protein insertion porin family